MTVDSWSKFRERRFRRSVDYAIFTFSTPYIVGCGDPDAPLIPRHFRPHGAFGDRTLQIYGNCQLSTAVNSYYTS
ncbi:MAG: hypothetical protein FWF82_01095 [Oscillospiraceae bacterium]|nr:hypothetical protein [Oscillospiraceae bacterium]